MTDRARRESIPKGAASAQPRSRARPRTLRKHVDDAATAKHEVARGLATGHRNPAGEHAHVRGGLSGSGRRDRGSRRWRHGHTVQDARAMGSWRETRRFVR